MIFLLAALITFFSSVISSMFGGGFGLLCIPSFYWLVATFYPHEPHAMQIAIASCGLCAVPMGVVATLRQARYRNIDFMLWRAAYPFMLSGGLVGAFVAANLHGDHLRYIFSGVLFLTAFWLFRFKPKESKDHVPKDWRLRSGCFGIGGLSTLVGMSIFNLPYFLKIGVSIKKAIGTSSLLVLSYASIAAIWFSYLGIAKVGISKDQIGYANIPLLVSAVIPCIAGALVGTRLVKVLPEKILKRGFILIMIAAATTMLF